MISRVTLGAALIALAVCAAPAGGSTAADARVTLKRISFTPATVRTLG